MFYFYRFSQQRGHILLFYATFFRAIKLQQLLQKLRSLIFHRNRKKKCSNYHQLCFFLSILLKPTRKIQELSVACCFSYNVKNSKESANGLLINEGSNEERCQESVKSIIVQTC